eukprot:8218919-Ditylum_brightwellii.AAC.1
MPAVNRPNSLPVDFIHVSFMLPWSKSSIDCFFPCLSNMWNATSAGCGCMFDGAAVKILGNGALGMIRGGWLVLLVVEKLPSEVLPLDLVMVVTAVQELTAM